jgi:hypothetical protein
MTMIQDHPKVAIAVALLVVALSLTGLFRDKTPSEIQVVLDAFYEDLIWQAEAVTAGLDDGAKVVVLVYDGEIDLGGGPRFKHVYRALEKTGLHIQKVDQLVYNETVGWKQLLYGFPYEEFLRVAREHPDVDGVISLCGVPYFSKGTERPDPSSLPPLCVTRVERWSRALQDLVDEGRVATAAVPRETSLKDGDDSADPFNQRYELLLRD